MPTVIQIKRGTASSWTSANTVLAAGEMGFETDTKKMKVGDGSTAWTSLAYTGSDGDITGVTAGTGLSGGGASGAVTLTNSMATEITAKGDLIVGTGNAVFDNLIVGTNGQVLTADSTTPTGLKYATPSSGALTLVRRVSFSGVTTTTTSFDAIFNSTYHTYLIVFETINPSSTGALRFNWRVSGATQSNNSYQGGSYGYQANAALMNDPFNPGTYATLKATGAGTFISGSIYAARVGQNLSTPYYYGHMVDNYNHAMLNVFADYNNTANHDGFILTASAGTLTGSISIYGLAIA